MELKLFGVKVEFSKAKAELLEFTATYEDFRDIICEKTFFARTISEARSEAEAILVDMVIKQEQSLKLQLVWWRGDTPLDIVECIGRFEVSCVIEKVTK